MYTIHKKKVIVTLYLPKQYKDIYCYFQIFSLQHEEKEQCSGLSPASGDPVIIGNHAAV